MQLALPPELRMRMRRMTFSSDLIERVKKEDLQSTLQGCLPADTLIYSLDGCACRVRPLMQAGIEVFDSYLVSETWPALEEGQLIPEIQTIFHPDRSPCSLRDEAIPPVFVYPVGFGTLNTHEYVVNKRTHTFDIPKDRETEDQLVIVIKPK